VLQMLVANFDNKMLRLFSCVRSFSTSMMYAAAYPHNHEVRPDSIAIYNKAGQVEQRNFLVLRVS
jgi:hypothetical protein